MNLNIDNITINLNAHNLHLENKNLIIFIHGAGFDRTAWLLQSRYIANLGNPIISIDLPGHGYSKSEPLRSIEEMSILVEKIIKYLGFNKAILIGHSMGSLVAVKTGLLFPNIIKKNILLGTAKRMQVSPILLSLAKKNVMEAIDMVINFSLPNNIKLNNNNSLPGYWLPSVARKAMSSCDLNSLYNDLLACDSFIIDDSDIRSYSIPTIIISGEKDIMTNKKQGIEFAALLNASSFNIKNCGHMMMIEKPDEINKILKAVLE